MASDNAVLESSLEYLSLNGPQRILYKIGHFFTSIPKKVGHFFQSIPRKARTNWHKGQGLVKTIYDASRYGDVFTRLSFLFMGTGLFTRHQIIRGSLYFLYEIFFFVFLGLIGIPNLAKLGTLGQTGVIKYTIFDSEGLDIDAQAVYDNSFTILLYSIITIVFVLILVYLWYTQLKEGLKFQRMGYIGKTGSDKKTLQDVLNKNYDKTLLSIPMLGLSCFTIIPIIMMILIAFTNYDSYHMTPDKLFDWVGMYNFNSVFSQSSSATSGNFLKIFSQVLLWTLVWAVLATFSNYFIGMIMAMIINIKGIKLKKLWRTILISTIAVPQFISLLLVSQMFADTGLINGILRQWGWIGSSPIKWLTDPLLAKVTIVLVNTWIGIPYTMLICTGLLMNIPDDLYESAKIDGASPIKMYFKITLPYMLFVTGPYLISQFIGNINNFNVIYLLSAGGPSYPLGGDVPLSITSQGLGQTDLLITWIYKISVASNTPDYGLASVLGILIFVIVAFFSLIFYGNSNSVKDEEQFQ
ncbi:MAG: ABC transporter permease subunit [Bacilli bacterium]